MDEGDMAQLSANFHLRAAVEKARRGDLQFEGNGFCMDCGEPIPEKRLQIMPNALRCAECKREREKNAL